MITIHVKFLSLLSNLIDTNELKVELPENSKINQLIPHLQKQIGEKFKKRVLAEENTLNNYVILVVNGKDIRALDGLETNVHDNDKISFLPALAGG
jgi:MoaD family protein